MLKKEKNRISRIKFFIRDFNSFEFKLFAFFVLFMVVTYMSYSLFTVSLNSKRIASYIYNSASDGTFSYNVFFESTSEECSNLLNELEKNENFSDAIDDGRIINDTRFWDILNSNSDIFKNVVSNNIQYQNYISEKGINIDYICSFAEKYSNCCMGLFDCFVYIFSIVFALISIRVLDFRKGLYIYVVIASVIISLSNLSYNMSDYYFISLIQKKEPSFTYDEYYLLVQYFVRNSLEGALVITFADILIQMYRDKKKKAKRDLIIYQSKYLVNTLGMQIDYLSHFTDLKKKIIVHENSQFSMDLVMKWCIEKRDINEYYVEIQKKYCERHRNKGLKYLEKYQSEFAVYDNCVTFLEFISSNMENFFAYEYIKKMEIGRENLLLVSEMIFKEFNGLPQIKEKMQ